MKIPLSQPDIGEREIEYVNKVLRSGQLSLGPRLAEFEEKFADYVGTRYAVATNSGTSALHLCVKALGIGAGDEVLTTSFSFVASANCLLYEKAQPIFVDVQPNTLNIDPAAIRDVLAREYSWDRRKCRHTNRRSGQALKAILPVHVFGQPCDMAAILEIAREFNLHVLEDACEAVGAEYRGQPVGTFGDAAVFAFYPNKQMTTAEGGMIVTDDAQLASLCQSLRNQGRNDDAGWLTHSRLGYNYRLSDLHCALGLAQLERIEELLASRARVAEMYSRKLEGAPGILLPADSHTSKRSWFAYVIQVQGARPNIVRDRLMKGLRERGIGCQAYFPPIHLQPYFREAGMAPSRPLPHTEWAAQSCLALPLFSAMTEDQVAEVCGAIRESLADIGSADGATAMRYSADAAD
jgi:dTDP-4-amino-4,6-dideoxygalactose transaminase